MLKNAFSCSTLADNTTMKSVSVDVLYIAHWTVIDRKMTLKKSFRKKMI